MLNARTGYVLGAAAVLLLLSPEARKTLRKWAVKGTEKALDLADQAKDARAVLQQQLSSLTEGSGRKQHTAGVEKVLNEAGGNL